MKFSHVISYLILPVITLCNSNIYSSDSSNSNSNDKIIYEPKPNPVHVITSNDSIKNVLGEGTEISTDKKGTFKAYYKPNIKINEKLDKAIEVNLWESDMKDIISLEKDCFCEYYSNGGFIQKSMNDGFIKDYKEKSGEIVRKQTGFSYPDGDYKYAVIEHNNKYYLAAYIQSSDNLLLDEWYLLDEEKALHHIGRTFSNLIQDRTKIQENLNKHRNEKDKYKNANTINSITKKISVGTSGNILRLNNSMLDKDKPFLLNLIKQWQQQVNTMQIFQQFEQRYNIINYFGKSEINELLDDIAKYYKLQRWL